MGLEYKVGVNPKISHVRASKWVAGPTRLLHLERALLRLFFLDTGVVGYHD